MPIITMKLYANLDAATTGDGKAVLDVPQDGEIECIGWVGSGIDAAQQIALLELSLASASGFTTNDTRAAFDGFAIGNAAAGGTIFGHKQTYFQTPLQVQGGERIHLHYATLSAGTLDTLRITVFIYLRTKGGGSGRTRRL